MTIESEANNLKFLWRETQLVNQLPSIPTYTFSQEPMRAFMWAPGSANAYIHDVTLS